MKKSRLGKFLIMLGCVIMVALPIFFINAKPIEAKAADSASYSAMKSMTTLSAMDGYLSSADPATLDLLNEDEIQQLIVNAYTILYTEPEIDNETEPVEETEGEGSTEGSEGGEVTPEPEPYDPPESEKLLYINIVNTLKLYYQQDDNYLKTDIHAPQSADDNFDYYIGQNSDFIGIPDEGFTVSRGTVTLHITSGFFTMHGPITVNGGTLNIVLETSQETHIKREVESNLRVNYKNTSETYIPVDARSDYSVTVDENNKTEFVIEQFGGAFFTVRSGTLNITGNGSDQNVILSGAGQYESNIALLRDNDTGNDNGGNVIEFPRLNHNTADDVEAKAPLIHVYDEKGLNPRLSLQYVSLRFNNNAGVVGTHNGAMSGGAMYVTGASPFVTMSHVEVVNCRTKHSGGFLHMSSTAGGSVSMSDVKVQGCYTDAVNATEGGTLRTLGSSHCALSMTRVTFIDNYSKNSASAFLWSSMAAGELVVTDCTVKNNVAYTGSAIVCMGRMSIAGNTSITGNRSITGDGGAISFTTWSSATRNTSFRLQHDSNLVLGSGVSITDNYAGDTGGAIHLSASLIRTNTNKDGGQPTLEYPYKTDANGNVLEGDDKYYNMSLIINGATITGNNAKKQGGAIFVEKSNTCLDYVVQVEVNGGNISNNSSGLSGGAFYMKGKDVNFTVTGGTISGNAAATHGGALCMEKNGSYFGNVYINGGDIIGNTASNKGGGFYIAGGSLTIGNGNLNDNVAQVDGGAIYVTGGNATISGGDIIGNTASNRGGGFYIDGGSLTIGNGNLNDNVAQVEGGAIYVTGGNATISGGIFSGNKAENKNQVASTGKGGAIYVLNGDLEVSSGEFTGNMAYYEGGALYVSGADCTAILNGGTLSGNEVTNGSGGAMYLYRASLVVDGGTITGNTASELGGGVVVNSAALTVKGDSEFSLNTASHGGAAYIVSGTYGSGSFHMMNGNVFDNTTTADGGAIYIRGDSNFMIDNGTIYNNTANQGGAVYLFGVGSFTMNNGTIRNNTSAAVGGAVCLKGTGTFTMNDGVIKDNTAGTFAGAVEVNSGGSFVMWKGTISGNKTVKNSGGAVRVEGGGSFTMHDGLISGNVSAGSAGAIRMSNGNFTMYNGIIENNSCNDSGGFMYMQGGTCTIYNGIIRNNHKTAADNTGGAILIGQYTGGDGVKYPGKFIMEDGEIYGNTSVENAGAISLADNASFEMRGGSIYSNTATKAGGAVYISSGHFTMTGGSIYGNTAGTNGGAVYLLKGNFTMSDGSINGNTATAGDGGAVYISVGNYEMTGGDISDNKAPKGNGGAVFVNQGDFAMKSGMLTGNTAPLGKGGAVYTGGTVTIGEADCNGESVSRGLLECPIISENSAQNGGAFAVNGGNPTIHCGSITDNDATNEGGAMYVNNGNVVVNYVVMERNTAVYGAGFSIVADTKNLSVTIASGLIKYNHASADGGGMKVHAKGSKVATIVVGLENCDGADDSAHRHPDLSANIAEGEGGGLHLVSDSANGLLFTMWCGRLYDNIANGNIPTGNMIQEGGQVSIHGTYTIDNVTVNNGSYLRPSYGLSTVTINFDYRFPDGYTDDTNALKSITLTKGEETSESMYINLPAYKNIVLDDATMILLRWSESNENNNVTYETSAKLVVNEANFNTDAVTFYGVWIARGAGIAEVPYVKDGQDFNTWQGGSSVAMDIGANGFFTALFEVSECDPSKFGERYLTFSRPFAAGTVITLVDLTAKSGYKNYYCYVINGEETTVSLSSFTKLGSPLVHWSNSRTDDTGNSEEDLMFMFDLGLSSETFTGGFWISLTRAYVDTTKAPISQTVSCAISEVQTPEISAPEESNVSDSVEITYVPGMAAEEDSVYYGKAAALVISGKETTLPPESYILIGETKYAVNTSGVIVIPIGDAKNEATLSMQLISSALTNSEMGIELNVDLYLCIDPTRPMNDKLIYSTEISMHSIPLPAVSIQMSERIFYIGSLPGSIAINVASENIGDKYRLEWTVLKQSFGATEYGSANGEATVTDGVLTFGQNVSEGNFRIIVKVIDKETGNEVLAVPYNFIVLQP